MLAEFVKKILSLRVPNYKKIGELEYTDKGLTLLEPPIPRVVECSTLQGLADLFEGGIDEISGAFVQIISPVSVALIADSADAYGRRRMWAKATYPECKTFSFGAWMDPETFIISAQQHFQRVKIENPDGSFQHDLDYVLGVASKITAENATDHNDDGFAQRVSVKQGIALKAETILKPMVQLAPYRTFAEIDQVLSQFVFRARIGNGQAQLALFEGDGGRWKLAAVAAIKAWLQPKFGDVPVIS